MTMKDTDGCKVPTANISHDTAQESQDVAQGARKRMEAIEDRLIAKFGTGDRPRLRRRFFERVARIVDTEGMKAYDHVCEAVTDASRARMPGRFFCASVKSRFESEGWLLFPPKKSETF